MVSLGPQTVPRGTMTSVSFLQTKNWAEFQRSLGRPFFEYDDNHVSAIVFRYPLPFGKSYLYIPHGPSLDLTQMLGGFKSPVRKFLGWLIDLARREEAIFIKIEPTVDYVAQLLVESGFKKSSKFIQPSKTVVVDLDESEENLLGRLHPKTRYNIKVAQKHGVEVKAAADIETFWPLIEKTAARDKFSSHPKSYYQKLLEAVHGGMMHTKLFTAFYNRMPVAAAIVLFYGDTGYYLHGASDYDSHKYMAPYLLHWETMRYLKSQALKKYDLWGIDAQRWPGVTRFKLGFGGRVVEYPGSFDLPVSKAWYLGYRILRRIF